MSELGDTTDGSDYEYDATVNKYKEQVNLTDTQVLMDNINLTKRVLKLTEEKMQLMIDIERLKGNLKVARKDVKHLKNKLKA